MTTFSPDEITLIKSILFALRGIKVRDIDKALMILGKSSDTDRANIPMRGQSIASGRESDGSE